MKKGSESEPPKPRYFIARPGDLIPPHHIQAWHEWEVGDNKDHSRICLTSCQSKAELIRDALEAQHAVGWDDEPPTEPGNYWLYGEESFGSMGGHYAGTILPEIRLHFVEVRAISNGLMAITAGRFISLKKFNAKKRQEGHIGLWQRVVQPTAPTLDMTKLFDTLRK